MTTECFKLLGDGEVVLSSDEFIDDDCVNWIPAEPWTIGRPWHNGLKPMRRKIGSAGATPSVKADYDYDPNLFYSGNRAKQTIRITFGLWHYRKVMEIEIVSNMSGLDAIRYAVVTIFEGLPFIERSPGAQTSRIVLEAENGDTMICDDVEDEGDDWLFKMMVGAEIIAVEAAGRYE